MRRIIVVHFILMVNSVLKKLGSTGLSATEIAALLEKHIGSASNEAHCNEALQAIARIKNNG